MVKGKEVDNKKVVPAPEARPKGKGPSVIEEKEDVFQAVLLADNFSSSIFGPTWAEKRYPTKNAFDDDDEEGNAVGNSKADQDQPIIDYGLSQESMIPLANRKLLDYSLEALTISGVQEIFLYCSSGVNGGNALKEHIRKSRWNNLSVKIHVISSEDCESLGDALRDLDGKGIIRNDFILMAPGVITNTALRPLLEEHRKTMKADKGAVMTLVHRKMPVGHRSRSTHENSAIVIDYNTGKIVAYSHKVQGKRLRIPVENLKMEMEVVLDTIDSGIAVCSSSVLPLFTDNFDFTDISDFIKNILINEEVMGNTIYLHQIQTGYATRIVDFDSFLGVSLDVMQRWSYPLVPDMPFGSNSGDSVYQMALNFIYKTDNVRTARDAAIGPAVIIGSDTVIRKGVIIKNSSVGNQCTLGENVKISNSQIGNNVTIEAGCVLEKCIVLDGTTIAQTMSIPALSLAVSNQIFAIQNPTDECESDGDDISEPEVPTKPGYQERDFKRFCEEVLESLHRGYTDNVDLDNLFVEIQGSRTANFMYFDEATVAVIKGILGLAPVLHLDFLKSALKTQWDKTKEIVVKFKDLLMQYVKTPAAQENLLQTIEEYANDNPYFRPLVMQLLHYYYNEDILAQEVILKWHKKQSLYDAGVEIRKLVQKFIEWLETASEESESGEDTDG